MASKFAVAILALLFAIPAHAGPLSKVKDFISRQVTEHPVRTRIVSSVTVDLLLVRGTQVCRQQNVENCQEHYGSGTGGYIADVSLDAVAQIVGYKIGGKIGDAISYGGTAVELGWTADQWHGGLNKPKEDSNAKVDFSRTILVHR